MTSLRAMRANGDLCAAVLIVYEFRNRLRSALVAVDRTALLADAVACRDDIAALLTAVDIVADRLPANDLPKSP